ncbi:hypothetical protein F383_22065 [Gossypium arboreum]|uniref:Uncharacterized protein n=1 Tax=Gossypium arboreum TaxID=29729 RepID=A0A0B0P2C7_GOSAR|nr:hypothetical protein F383_22065 [Gossypium arboreum]
MSYLVRLYLGYGVDMRFRIRPYLGYGIDVRSHVRPCLRHGIGILLRMVILSAPSIPSGSNC